MAKFTDYGMLTAGQVSATDKLLLLDTSDTSMDPTGTTKQSSVADVVATSSASFPYLRDNDFYMLTGLAAGANVGAGLVRNGAMSGWFIHLPQRAQIDGVKFYLRASGGVGAKFLFGIYATSLGAPTGAALVSSGEFDATVATGYKTMTFTGVDLSPGVYIAVVHGNDATADLARPNGGGHYPTSSYQGGVYNHFAANIAYTGTLPSSPALNAWDNTTYLPWVEWRVQI